MSVDDFYRTEHKIIFKTILKLFTEGSPVDVLSLLEELRRTKDIDKIGYELIYALADAGYTTAYVESHAKVIKEKSELRKILYFAESLADDVASDFKPLADIISHSQSFFQDISNSSASTSFDFVQTFKHNFKSVIDARACLQSDKEKKIG